MIPILLVPSQDPPLEPAQEAPASNPFMTLMPFLLIGVVFWVLLIAPERKNRRRREAMLKDLAKDDKVMTTGGLYGRVAAVDEETVSLQVADNLRLKFARAAIQTVLDDSQKGEKDKGSK